MERVRGLESKKEAHLACFRLCRSYTGGSLPSGLDDQSFAAYLDCSVTGIKSASIAC